MWSNEERKSIRRETGIASFLTVIKRVELANYAIESFLKIPGVGFDPLMFVSAFFPKVDYRVCAVIISEDWAVNIDLNVMIMWWWWVERKMRIMRVVLFEKIAWGLVINKMKCFFDPFICIMYFYSICLFIYF